MGTLTAGCPRLDTHCPHKLATSCRLTSTPKCCACYDRRPHSQLYRVYIDGVGYVQRGTRWQSYCWFCKEFWNNRLAATDPPLEARQTQIPHIPDQTEFLGRWFEFHQGYRTVAQPDGTETRIAVIGEPFREVSPGFLPRTLDQLRAGRENDASRPENIFTRRRLTSEEERPQEVHQSIEDALDDLLEGLSDDDAELDPPPQGTHMPRRSSSAGLSRPLTRTEVGLQRARDRIVRVFGSREDVQREDYESPLSTMYNRAEERYRQAEERRATGETTDPRLNNMNDLPRQERRDLEEQILWGVLQDSRQHFRRHQEGNVRSYTPAPLNRRREDSATSPALIPPIAPTLSLTSELFADGDRPASSTPSIRASLIQIENDLTRLQQATDAVASARIALVRQRPASRPPLPEPVPTLDEPDRPPPLTDAQMTKKLDCQVCYSQIADIAVLPCGHMVMCQWCADIAIPVRHSHIPARPSKCPMCRKTVKQRFKIHVAGNDVVQKEKYGQTRVMSRPVESVDNYAELASD
ncbi:hypothetical protein BU23DRAFT_600686 [Bimuria novae-zelandiae CBS 107.79]|uniref:RING-type domain-containing protein n=1 Tax=Bimuria novae-zelandiae CBS 107.79 TaxID=1447943 RepID=A0A6A5V1K2_9PLEO|nr:hypothetical protein BU23DRAFT_600686 [Bimuria novae-zelandiae CBS 107.79]